MSTPFDDDDFFNQEATRAAEKLNTYTLTGWSKHETDKAILIEFEDPDYDDGRRRSEWFPLSQIHEIHRQAPEEVTYYDGEVKVVMSRWIAEKKGLA